MTLIKLSTFQVNRGALKVDSNCFKGEINSSRGTLGIILKFSSIAAFCYLNMLKYAQRNSLQQDLHRTICSFAIQV